MNLIGSLYGMEVYTSEYCVSTSIAFTRKQTRKFKNHRWVKKYLKKYSYEVSIPTMINHHNRMVMHPECWEAIQAKAEEQRLIENTQNHTLDAARYSMLGRNRLR